MYVTKVMIINYLIYYCGHLYGTITHKTNARKFY